MSSVIYYGLLAVAVAALLSSAREVGLLVIGFLLAQEGA